MILLREGWKAPLQYKELHLKKYLILHINITQTHHILQHLVIRTILKEWKRRKKTQTQRRNQKRKFQSRLPSLKEKERQSKLKLILGEDNVLPPVELKQTQKDDNKSKVQKSSFDIFDWAFGHKLDS